MKPPIYLDYNATTPLDPRVLEAMLPVLKTHFGNPASSTHSFGWYVAELVNIAREEVASLINASPEEIIFTSGATEANNLAIKGIANSLLNSKSEKTCRLISVAIEHKSVLDPLKSLQQRGANLELLPVNEEGMLDSALFAQAAGQDTLLASIMLANNEIGTIHDIGFLTDSGRGSVRYFHCDATQAAGRIPIDVQELSVDLMSLSAHKVYGPKGVGALYVRKTQPPIPLSPLLEGGGHEQGYRSGTLNVPAIVGFGKACAIARAELERDSEQVKKLSQMLLDLLQENIPGIELNGSREHRLPGNLNISIEGINNARLIGQIGTRLAISLSSACQSAHSEPSHVLQALGIPIERQQSSIRIGIGRFSAEQEIICAAEILTEAVKKIQRERNSG